MPGLKVVQPSTPADAKGLLLSAIDDPDPVMIFEHKLLYKMRGPVPDGRYTVPIGKAAVRREGRDLTIVATAIMVHRALEAAEALAGDGIEAEVIDLRTIRPMDRETVLASVRRTGRLLIVYEGVTTLGVGAEVSAMVAESDAFDFLDAPIVRLGGAECPIPYNPELERAVVPQVPGILDAARGSRAGTGLMPTEVIMPKVDMDMARGRIVAWHVEEGAQAEKGAPLFDIETDKAAMEVESPASGRVHHRVPEGTETPIGEAVAWLYAEDEAVGDAPPGGDAPEEPTVTDDPVGTEEAPDAAPPERSRDRPRATPAARRRAREAGIGLSGLTGSGPRNRVQAADVPDPAEAEPATRRPDPHPPAPPLAAASAPAQGGALRVLRGGAATGAPIVLLHGFAADASIWEPILPHLGHRPLIRIELPGHGGSPRRAPGSFAALAAELRAAFDALHAADAHVIGHSLGGALALALADTRARRIGALTLIAPAGLGPEVNGDLLAGLCRATRAESLAPWLRTLVADERIVTEGYARAVMAARADPALREAQSRMAEALFPDGVQAFDLAGALGRLAMPSRIVWGRRDRMIPWRHALRAEGGTALHLFDGLGHMPQIEAPERIGPLLAAP